MAAVLITVDHEGFSTVGSLETHHIFPVCYKSTFCLIRTGYCALCLVGVESPFPAIKAKNVTTGKIQVNEI